MKVLSPEFSHADSRRRLTQLFTQNVAQVNEYEISKGAVLGNHYHKSTHETFYITKGVIRAIVGDAEFVASKGTVFIVEPYETHTIEAVSDKVTMMTFLSKPYTEKDPDIWKE